MGFSHLLSTEASLANFREVFNILGDVDVAYCHEGDIALHRRSGSNIVFFPLMAILGFLWTLFYLVPLAFMVCVLINFLPIFTKS